MSESTTTKRRTSIPSIDPQYPTAIASDAAPAISSDDNEREVWVVTQRYGQAVAITGVFGSKEKLLKKYPLLHEEGALYRDCDPSGNGLTARKFIIN